MSRNPSVARAAALLLPFTFVLHAAAARADDAPPPAPAVAVDVDEPGAEILIDGQSVGTQPIGHPLPIAPGKHTVAARGESKTAVTRTIEVGVGETTSVVLRLHPYRQDVVGYDLEASDAKTSAAHARHVEGLVLIGASASVVALATAIGLNLAANGRAHDANAKIDAIHAAGGGSASCHSPSPAFAASCQGLSSDLSSRDTLATYSAVSYAVAGAAAVATVAYVFWPRKNKLVRVLPEIGRASGGLNLAGSF